MQKLIIGLMVSGTILISFLLFQNVKTAPLFYIGLLASVMCLYLSYELKRWNLWKAVFFNLGVIMLLGGLAEAYLTWFHLSRVGDVMVQEDFLQGRDYYVSDDARGYAAGPNVKKRVKKTLEDKVIYDVIYTTNQYGLRVSPTEAVGDDQAQDGKRPKYENVVFFGDSFTYGEGVNDNETFPYLFEEFSGGRYRAYNLAFHGYGSQQMLRLIETGFLEKIISEQQPLVVIYGALVQHIERAAGKLIWDAKIPRYKLSSTGTVEYAGTFENDPQFKKHLEYSRDLANPRFQLITQTARLIGEGRTSEEIQLFLQMVRQSANLLEKKYKVKFIVLLWPLGDKDTEEVVSGLKNAGIEVVVVDQVFQEYKDPRDVYAIEYDNHPTKLANERIARYLLKYLQ